MMVVNYKLIIISVNLFYKRASFRLYAKPSDCKLVCSSIGHVTFTTMKLLNYKFDSKGERCDIYLRRYILQII